MPDFLRALIVILVLAITVFAFAGRPVSAIAMKRASFLRRRNLWIAITTAVFLANNYWIYIVVVAALLISAVRKEHNLFALFFFVLFAIPSIPKEIGGLGLINFLFAIDYTRLLALVVLLPAFYLLRNKADSVRLGRLVVDKVVLGFLSIQLLLHLGDSSITNALRLGFLYPFLGIFLPYFVASRSLRTLEGFREVMMAYVIAAMLLSAIAFFEMLKHWLLYTELEISLGVTWDISKYMVRAGGLRVMGSTGQPIALGFAITVGIGFLLYLRPIFPDRRTWTVSMGLLLGGLLLSISRGPWVGAVLLFLVFLLTGAERGKQLLKTAGIVTVFFLVVMASPLSENLMGYLPWVGNIDQSTVDYRRELLDHSIRLLSKHPLFGARDFLTKPSELDELAIGTGFVDVVNTYIRVGLTYGLVGLALFVGSFATVIVGITRTMRRFKSKNEEGYRLGQALLSVLLSIAFMIGTVSSITVIPWIYWSVIGMGSGYILMMRQIHEKEMQSVVDDSSSTTYR